MYKSHLKCWITVAFLLLFSMPLAADRSDIHELATDVQPLLPGMPAPAFTLKDGEGTPVVFDPQTMKRPLILTFYRGGWCPYCNLHLAELRKAEQELASMGFDIWFISVDQPSVLYDSLQDPDIGYRVLSDAEIEATRAFGIAFRMSDEQVEKYKQWGIDLEAASGQDHHVLPAPATFLVGDDGIIRFQYTNPDITKRLHPDLLLAAARVYQGDTEGRLKQRRQAQ